MNPDPKGWHGWRWGFLLLLILSVPRVGVAKTKNSVKGGDFDLTGIVRPELVNAPADPALRYPIMTGGGGIFGVTYGWLDISNNTIRYTVAQPAGKSSHSFEVSRFGITDLRLANAWLIFRSDGRSHTLTYLSPDRWGSVHTAPGMSSAANRETLGTSSIYKTLLNFDRVMAMVNPPSPPPSPVVVQPVAPTPPPKPAAPAAAPAIVLSSPPGARDNQTLEWTESTLVIRGAAMDSSGIPVVKINGSPANMRPQTTQAAEFWSDPIALREGNNSIQIVASNSAHMETDLALTIHYKPQPATEHPKPAPENTRALDRAEIISLLQGGVAPAHIIDLIRERGIKFTPNDDDVKAFRAAGGTDDLIEVLQQAAPHP
jgi:hypothetical protein